LLGLEAESVLTSSLEELIVFRRVPIPLTEATGLNKPVIAGIIDKAPKVI
jgi:hypothetical protein